MTNPTIYPNIEFLRLEILGFTRDQLATKLGITRKTLQGRMEGRTSFTDNELLILEKLTKRNRVFLLMSKEEVHNDRV